MQKIGIIGGSGFLGTSLIECLGVECSINYDKNESIKFSSITKISDICDNNFIDSLSSDVDTIVLLAAEHRDDVTPVSLYYQVNVDGMQNVLQAMNKHNIDNIIFTSSVAVYGSNPDSKITEKSKINPDSIYGISKYVGEMFIKQILYYTKSKTRIFRVFNTFGPG